MKEYVRDAGLPNLLPPLEIDVATVRWEVFLTRENCMIVNRYQRSNICVVMCLKRVYS